MGNVLVKLKRMRPKVLICSVVFILSAYPVCKFAYKVHEYKVGGWFVAYLGSLFSEDKWKVANEKHVVLVFADHHEPGTGQSGVDKSRYWCDTYSKNMEDVTDHFGNSFRYTFFYAVDHANAGALAIINQVVRRGLGEIELHLHHEEISDEGFEKRLVDGMDLLSRFGAFGRDAQGAKKFAYIAGNWNLDNGKWGKQSYVSRQIDVLRRNGCYADLTFSTVMTDAQPDKVNSLYYAFDDDRPKSYNSGIDVTVGNKVDGFLIMQGPAGFDLKKLYFEWGAIEAWLDLDVDRFANMLHMSPSVVGAEHVKFVKLHTHGIQSRSLVLSPKFVKFWNDISDYCKQEGIALHYASAREAYNIAKALEDGRKGDVEKFRDYVIGVPDNVNYSVAANESNDSSGGLTVTEQ